jgi:hypothetical protein
MLNDQLIYASEGLQGLDSVLKSVRNCLKLITNSPCDTDTFHGVLSYIK